MAEQLASQEDPLGAGPQAHPPQHDAPWPVGSWQSRVNLPWQPGAGLPFESTGILLPFNAAKEEKQWRGTPG